MMLDTTVNYILEDEKVAAEVIQQEVFNRSKVRWKINDPSCTSKVILTLDESLDHDEKYVVEKSSESSFVVRGKTRRALLYGAGKFLRSLILAFQQDYNKPYTPDVRLKNGIPFPITSTPKYTWRGHQIAYRPKTHSYDAVPVEVMKQEILEHVLFGINTIEMIPPKLDDCQQSPHFMEPWIERLADISKWCDKLGVKVSLWYPAFPGADWQETFSAIKRLDILFVPGGDPGGRPAAELFMIIRQHAAEAKKFFPKVEVWVSSQYGLSVSKDLSLQPWSPKERLEGFYEEVPKNLDVLTGIVYGPWTADTTKQFRNRIHASLPIRFYPDLCHNLKSHYPVGPRWDWPFALAYTRESINPRPKYFADTFQYEMPWCVYGAGTYSEGCGDDVNKHVWASMLWGQKNIDEIMKEYADWYFGDSSISEVIFMLEQNWLVPLSSGHVMKTLEKLVSIQNKMSCRMERNWRWQMICFRVYCDAFLYQHLHGGQNQSLAWPSERQKTVPWLTETSKNVQTTKYSPPSAMALYGRLEASSGILHALVGMQLDVERYGSMHEERGGHTDILKHLPKDDGIQKGPFKVKRLHDVPTTGQEGPIVEFADTTHPTLASLVSSLPSRWLSFYTCIWPSALPMEAEIQVPNGGAIEIVYVGQDLLLEGGDYEELFRTALPTRCSVNGTLLHDYKEVEAKTKSSVYQLPKGVKGKVTLTWDVEDRSKITVRQVLLPVADIVVHHSKI